MTAAAEFDKTGFMDAPAGTKQVCSDAATTRLESKTVAQWMSGNKDEAMQQQVKNAENKFNKLKLFVRVKVCHAAVIKFRDAIMVTEVAQVEKD